MKYFKTSLIRKIAVVSVLNILVGCMLIITMGSLTLSNKMDSAIRQEMNLSAHIVSLEIDQVFSSVLSSVQNLAYGAGASFQNPDVYNLDSETYEEIIIDPETGDEEVILHEEEPIYSMVQPQLPVTMVLHDFEKFSIQTMTNIFKHSDNIVGVGILFEPDGFLPGVENYSTYVVSTTTEDNITHFLDYSDYQNVEYFSATKSTAKSYVTTPYVEGGTTVVTVCEPILNMNNQFVGMVGADVAVDQFGGFLLQSADYPTMQSTILDHNLNIAYTTRTGVSTGDSLNSIINNSSDMATINSNITAKQSFEVETQMAGGAAMTRFFDPIHVGDYTWWAVTSLENSDMNSSTVDSVTQLVIASLFLLTFSVFFQVGHLQRTLRPISKVVSAAQQISQGDLNVDVQVKTGDELEQLGTSFSNMAKQLQAMVFDIKRVLQQICLKNLDVTPSAEFLGDFSEIEGSMVTIVQTINDIVQEINLSSRQVAAGASNVTSGSMVLSQGATEQASSIETLSTQVDKISEKITLNAGHSTEANEIFIQLVADIRDGNMKMRDLIQAMSDISVSSEEISKIVKTISDIAGQTNILALNASVEAARAGESGKGFAVVASEVKTLAQKSAEASKSTSALIQNSIEVVKRGSDLASSAEESLNVIIEQATRTTSLIDGITQASSEQASAIQDVTSGIHQITGVVQNNSSAAVESAAASEQLLAQSENLQTMVNEFNLRN